jgi:DNA-directed RNA polymerase specialized sigma24 family protein
VSVEELIDLTRAIDDLPRNERITVVLCDLVGATQGEVSDVLGLSETRIGQLRTAGHQHIYTWLTRPVRRPKKGVR